MDNQNNLIPLLLYAVNSLNYPNQEYITEEGECLTRV